ncbi:hypothetical protein BJV74DRAFT_212896 [Russula compacta]|nr:hypothetical protein BJV74DRAFT_212896 [Russula compacta]
MANLIQVYATGTTIHTFRMPKQPSKSPVPHVGRTRTSSRHGRADRVIHSSFSAEAHVPGQKMETLDRDSHRSGLVEDTGIDHLVESIGPNTSTGTATFAFFDISHQTSLITSRTLQDNPNISFIWFRLLTTGSLVACQKCERTECADQIRDKITWTFQLGTYSSPIK